MARLFRKHTPDERERLYQIYQNEFSLGKTTKEIAVDLDLSESTLYRWQRLKNEESNSRNQHSTSINKVIEVLCSEKCLFSYEILHNICLFNAWLRWPTQPINHYHALTAGIFQYLWSKFGKVSVADLDDNLKQGVMRHVSIEKFAEMCTPNFAGQSDFTFYRLSGQNYTQIEAVANLGWYLIASERKPSFAGAHSALVAGINGYTLNYALWSFRNLWRHNLPASPFLFVQTYHSSLTWTLDPFSAGYVDIVDELVRVRPGSHDALAMRRTRSMIAAA